MGIKTCPKPLLSGFYDMKLLQSIDLIGAHRAHVGMVRIASGGRSPPEGYRANARNEIAVVLSGSVRVETATSDYILSAGHIFVSGPGDEHATIALEDAEIFYTLIDPRTVPR